MAQKKPDGWIRIGDFEEVFYQVQIKNTTTSQPVPPSKDIEVNEVSESGMTMKLPKRSCSNGHLLVVEIERHARGGEKAQAVAQPKGPMAITVTAKVTELEPMGDSAIIVRLHFYQFRTEDWQLFLADYADRQRKVDQIVHSIQGRKAG